MTARQLHPLLGRLVYLTVNGIDFACVITDAKRSYGRERYQLEPVVGEGTTWVNAGRVRPVPHEEARRICK
jgi:hypothetical protein